MEQKWIVVIIIAFFAFLSICYTVYKEGKEGILKKIENFFGGKRIEHFTVNEGLSVGLKDFEIKAEGENLLTNSNFESGYNVTQFIESVGNNSIVTYPNPGTSSFVLRQIFDGKTSETFYKLSVSLKPNTIYKLSSFYYSPNNMNLEHTIVSVNNDKLKLSTLSEPIENSKFTNNYCYFTTGPSDKPKETVIILIGHNDKNKNKEESYLTNLILTEISITNFIPVLENLRNYYNCFNPNSFNLNSDVLKDLSSYGFDWNVSRPGALVNKSIKLSGTSLIGPNSYILQNSNKINLDTKFCLFFDIKGLELLPTFDKEEIRNQIVEGFNSIPSEENSMFTSPPPAPNQKFISPNHGLILTIPGNQEYSIELYLPKKYDFIALVAGGIVYKTSVKIINAANHVYSINYDGNTIYLYMDEQELLRTECPNLYFNNDKIEINSKEEYDGLLYSFAYYNTTLSIYQIQLISSYLRKIRINKIEQETSTSNSTTSSNSIDTKNTPTPKPKETIDEEEEDNSPCPKMIYEKNHYYVLIPQNSYLCKKLGYYGLKDYGRDINTAKHIYETNFPNCPLPDILNPKKYKPNMKNCPFIIHQDNPCSFYDCKDANWNSNNINNENCRKRVDTYCSINYQYDPACYCWRPDQINNQQCLQWRGKFEPKDKCNFSKHNINDHPDSKNWIRKDKIPCWNCNLTAPEVGQQPCSEE